MTFIKIWRERKEKLQKVVNDSNNTEEKRKKASNLAFRLAARIAYARAILLKMYKENQ